MHQRAAMKVAGCISLCMAALTSSVLPLSEEKMTCKRDTAFLHQELKCYQAVFTTERFCNVHSIFHNPFIASLHCMSLCWRLFLISQICHKRSPSGEMNIYIYIFLANVFCHTFETKYFDYALGGCWDKADA